MSFQAATATRAQFTLCVEDYGTTTGFQESVGSGAKATTAPSCQGAKGRGSPALPGAHGNQAQKSSGPPSYSARTPFGFFRLRAAGGSRGLMGSSFDDDDDEQQQQQGTWVGGWLGGWVLSGLQTGVFLIKNKFRFSK